MTIQMKSTRLPDLFAALFLLLTLLGTSCSKHEAASNEPAKAKPFEGQIFRTADDSQTITLVSQDELEMRGGDVGAANLICKYTRQDDTLRVVKTMLGTTQAVYYKITPEGLKANDGTVLLSPAVFFVTKAGAALQSGDHEAGIAKCNEAIRLNPKLARAYSVRGAAYAVKGDSDRAIQDFTQAIILKPETAPEMAPTYYIRGAVYHDCKGDYERAIQDYNRALECDPKLVIANNGRGCVKRSKGDLDGAIADFDRAIRLDPKCADAYNNRGEVYFIQRKWAEALADYRSRCELNQKDRDYPHLKIWLILARLDQKSPANFELVDYMGTRLEGATDDWPVQIARFLLDKTSESDFLAAADSSNSSVERGKRCSAWFYAGMKRLLAGDKATAADYFRRSLGTGEKDRMEYAFAQSELKALKP